MPRGVPKSGKRKVKKRKAKAKPRAVTTVEVPQDWMPVYKEWPERFHEKQKEYLFAVKDNKEVVFVAGNGSGKSLIFYWSMTAFLLGMHPMSRHLGALGRAPIRAKILVNDFEHGMQKVAHETLNKGTYLKDLGEEIGPILPPSMVKKFWTKEDKTLYLTNGSRAEFMTSEQQRRQHSGTNFDILGCDEEAKEPAYDESKRGLRTAKGGGRILWAFTPPYDEGQGPSWSKYKLFDPWEAGELDHVHIIRASMRDNPAIDDDYIKWFSQGKTEEQLRVQLHGEFPTWGKMVHGDFSDKLWDAKEKTGNLLPNDWQVPFDDPEANFEMAIDWHQSKPCAAVWTVTTRGGDVVVYDELSPQLAQDKTISELAEIFMEIEGQRFGPRNPLRIRRIGEPKMKDKSNAMIRGFNAWQEFRNCGIVCSEGYNRQPDVGISIVNDFIRGDTINHPRLFVKENLPNLRKYMRNHYWTAPTGFSPGKPDPKWSDYPICVRWIVQQKARTAKRGMKRRVSKWPLTSYGGDKRYGPYTGVNLKDNNYESLYRRRA